MAAASFAYWPAVLLMMGVMLFLHGFLPRLSVSLTWAVYGLSVMIAMFGPLFSLSEDAIKSTPFGAVPRMPIGRTSRCCQPGGPVRPGGGSGSAGNLAFPHRDIVP